jgi:hypothetical protein
MLRFVRPSIHGEWGSFDFVAIALASIDELLAWRVPFDYAAFISGQDYPIAALARFEGSLKGDGAILADDSRPKSLDRYRFAYYRLPRKLEVRNMHRFFFLLQTVCRVQPFLRFTTGRVGCRVGIRRANVSRIDGLLVRKGLTWWTLSRRAVAYVQSFVHDHKHFVSHFATRVILPDEAFFQTILTNTDMSFNPDDGRFMRWSFEDAMNPEVLTVADFDALTSSGKFFARKFDTRVDERILDLLDEYNHVGKLGRRADGLYA